MNNFLDMIIYHDDFLGHGELPSSQSDSDWLVDDTSSSGTPTYTKGGIGGEATLALASTAEVENVCLHHGDDLNFDIDDLKRVTIKLKGGQAALDSATQLAFGMCSARNDAIDSIAEVACFRVIGADDTTAVVCESDDGSNNNDDVVTGQVLVDSYKRFVIDFSGGKSDVKFYMDNGSGALVRVASSTTFNMSNYSGGLQPFIQIQKTSDTNTDSVVIDYVHIECARA
jgi:hypothetical protein